MSTNINQRRLFSREDPGVLSNFIRNAEEAAGHQTTVTPADIVAATESALAAIKGVGGLSRRRRRDKKFITLSIPCRAGGAGLRVDVMIDRDGLLFIMSASVVCGSGAAA